MPNSLPPDYRPSDGEEFMNPRQLEYFRQKLLRWRSELLEESSETLIHLKEESLSEPDITARKRCAGSGIDVCPVARWAAANPFAPPGCKPQETQPSEQR